MENSNRIIKFRAWDKKNRKLLSQVEWIDGKLWDENLEPEEGVPLSEVELMQDTGLKDKNGKEIYEGDIVQWKIDGDWSTWTKGKPSPRKMKVQAQIMFGTGGIGRESGYVGGSFIGWYLADKEGNTMERAGETYDFASEEVEIIGNIYENPELIK